MDRSSLLGCDVDLCIQAKATLAFVLAQGYGMHHDCFGAEAAL
jgi:hypothetical protein